MKMKKPDLTMTINREPFLEIKAGSKKYEYREVKEYWTKRIEKLKLPFILKLRNGMSPNSPFVILEIDSVEVKNLEEQKYLKAGMYYALHINEILNFG